MTHEQDNAWWQNLIAFAESKQPNEAVLCGKIMEAAHKHYNSTSKNVTARTLFFWGRGQRVFPLWARTAIVHVCKDFGWKPQTQKDFDLAYSLWAKWYDPMTPLRFASDFNIGQGEILKFTKS